MKHKSGTGEIPFRVIGRKYTEGTNSQPHAYNALSVPYIEGEAWQDPTSYLKGWSLAWHSNALNTNGRLARALQQ